MFLGFYMLNAISFMVSTVHCPFMSYLFYHPRDQEGLI